MRDATESAREQRGDEGFLLMGALVLIFLLLLTLAIAAPRIARGLQRDREQESARRAQQYVRAIRVYYRKLGHYPGSIEQLEKTNNQRFLRQRYEDPLTGKADWRLIHVGENQTKVKGFFGEELQGVAGGLGSAAGMVSPAGAANVQGSSNSSSSGSAFAGSTPVGGGQPGLGSGNVGATSTGTNAGTGVSSQSASGQIGTGGPIMGLGSAAAGEAMLVVNEQTTYNTWEFLYDPRIEQMYAKAILLGGGVAAGGASGFGSAAGAAGGAAGGATPAPGNGAGSGLPAKTPQ